MVARSLAAIGVVGVLSSLTVVPFVWFEARQAQHPAHLSDEDEISPPAVDRPIMPLRARPSGPGPMRAAPPRARMPMPRSQAFRPPPSMRPELEIPWIGGAVNLIPVDGPILSDY